MEHCIVDGNRCSKCCDVLTIKECKNFREWRRWVRWHGVSEDEPDTQLYEMVIPISKRRAKKRNPYLVKIVGNSQSYFTCKHFKNSVCNNYENRPKTCSDYPYYGRTEEEWIEYRDSVIGGLYDKDCTFFIKVS